MNKITVWFHTSTYCSSSNLQYDPCNSSSRGKLNRPELTEVRVIGIGHDVILLMINYESCTLYTILTQSTVIFKIF